ncbi:MAG: DNA-processing protein DprA [Thomasclavelia sp.]|nr:DNA-processing protein DprA [Thomasclavelia sp.]
MEDILLFFALKYEGNFQKIYDAIDKKEKVNQDEVLALKKTLQCKYSTIISDDYPERLKHIPCPPFVVFYYGDLSILSNKAIGVIGKRVPSEYGEGVTDKLVNDLVKNDFTIVSGMALGIDTIAHRSALKNNGKTVAILASGIEYCYPKRNLSIYQLMKNNHLVISEKGGSQVPYPEDFRTRNRLISGLSDGVLVTESDKKSGTMITVGYALEQGKDVYAIPSRINDAIGCNCLIQQGAKLTMSVDDIIHDG